MLSIARCPHLQFDIYFSKIERNEMMKTMNPFLPGVLIRQARLARSWSQEGLCKGICAVSYLSKIEQGQVQPSPEVLHLLLAQLDIRWYDAAPVVADVAALIEQGFDSVLSMDEQAAEYVRGELEAQWEVCANGPYVLDALLLRAYFAKNPDPYLDDFTGNMELRQRTLWLLLNQRADEALRLNPIAFCYAAAGFNDYENGHYTQAISQLQRGYELAAKDGYLFLMLQCSTIIGNCYSNMLAFEEMTSQYQITARLAKAVGNIDIAQTIQYNVAATQLELGQIEPAYKYFSNQKEPSAGTLHKLAICCEKLGKTEEALAALDSAQTAKNNDPGAQLWSQCCALVRYRLEHPGYLRDDTYGSMLLTCFNALRKDMPSGYAGFHLPWVMEWYKANRQYKQAYELLIDFPGLTRLMDH